MVGAGKGRRGRGRGCRSEDEEQGGGFGLGEEPGERVCAELRANCEEEVGGEGGRGSEEVAGIEEGEV